MSEVYIGLGSNLNNPLQQVISALDALHAHPDLTLLAQSSLYRSLPWGVENQPCFINAVAKLDTALTPVELLQELQSIEKKQERVRSLTWGPRTLDLDILLYDQIQVDSAQLTIPHLYLTKREFVVYPLAEVSPALTLPTGESIQNLVTRLSERAQQLVKVG